MLNGTHPFRDRFTGGSLFRICILQGCFPSADSSRCKEMIRVRKVKVIRIWFENCMYLEIGIEDFEWIHIDNVCKFYRKIDGSECLEEKFKAIGEVSFRLKSEVKNGCYRAIDGSDAPIPEGMTIQEGIFFRLQEYMDITQLVLCYDDGSEKMIWVPYENKFSGGEESWLQSTELDEYGLTVTILPERQKDEVSMPS